MCDPFEESNEGLSIEVVRLWGREVWRIQKGEVQVIVSIDFHNVLDEPLDVRELIGIDERACIPVSMNIGVAPIDGNAADQLRMD